MADQIFLMIGNVAVAVSEWFSAVFNSSGMTALFLGMIAVVFSVRLLMHPIVGRGSDTADQKKQEDDD